MNTLIKLRNKYQTFIENNFLAIQLYFSVALVTFIYLMLHGTEEITAIKAIIYAIFWPITAAVALLFH